MKINSYQKRTWAEVLVENVKFNFDVIKSTATNSKVCCVIKANAYGHGAVKLAKIYQEKGADFLAVSNIEEAIQLRKANIYLPILILGYTDPECASILSKYDLSQCVFSKEFGESLNKFATEQKVTVKTHLKVDTGMGRIGFNARVKQCEKKVLEDIKSVYALENLSFEGIFTHFASADEGDNGEDYTNKQFDAFCFVIEYLKNKNINVGLRHCANSATIFDYPKMHLDMVRAGIVLYGVHPSNELKNRSELKPTLKLLSVVDFIKEVDIGDSVSYGREYVAKEKRKIATLPIGYADGFWRANFRTGGVVEINGKYAPIVGRVCMDQCMIDITDLDDVKIGSIATVYGLDGENSVNKIAEKNKTINYEILCAIGKRVPRVYTENGEVLCIEDDIISENI